MRVSYYSVYDKKSLVFGQVFPAPTPGAAERMIEQTVNTPGDNLICKYPEDFALYYCFTFDDSVGELCSSEDEIVPRLVVEAVALVRS
ncbi:MAG: nonstructural protein [Microvirus sp.]|nr:MAG: nonstructural protein [Microvirus sp.]